MPTDTTNPRANGKSAEKSEKYDRKLADILGTAARVFAEEGYDPASIRMVAERAGVSVAGLYYYVRSKEELLYLIQYHVFDGLVRRFKEDSADLVDPVARLELFIRNHLERFLADMSSLTVCSRELGRLRGDYLEQVEARQREYFSQASQLFGELERQHGGARVDPRTAALAMFGTINWVYTWYQSDSGQTAAQLARDFVQLYLYGVLPGEPSAGTPPAEPRTGDGVPIS
jgi:AcrR family transcriptional regulator